MEKTMNEYDYSKKCILTPTFSGHFQYLKNYLNSFRKNVEDRSSVVIFFIINASENLMLKKIIDKYSDLNIEILFFEDILKKFNINETPEALLEKYGKFSFQALKKFYGMLFLEKYEHFLVLDTESMWVNKTNMSDLFRNFFENPFILYSNVKKRLLSSEGNLNASKNINFILQSHCDKWFVEQFMRFWDVNILKNIFKKYGSCFEIVQKLYDFEKKKPIKMGLFESVLYDQYVYENVENYQKYDIDKVMSDSMSSDIKEEYLNHFYHSFAGASGVTEHFAILLNKKNIASFIDIFKKLHIEILRVDDPYCKNIYNEISFLKIMRPKILTCSQNHCYIEKHDFFRMLFFKQINKLKKQISLFLFPFKRTLQWLFSPFKVAEYVLCLFFKYVYFLIISTGM